MLELYDKLHYRSILKLTGKDSITFLDNLLTNKIITSSGKLIYSLLLSPQGKLLYDLFIFFKEQEVYIDVYKGLANELLNLFSLYKLHSDVKLDKMLNMHVIISNSQSTDISFIDPRDSKLGFREYITDTCNNLDGLHQGYIKEYDKTRLSLLLPEFGIDFLSGQFYPLDLSSDKFNAISFDKGCYVGQEVIAKLHYRGKRKRQISLINLNEYSISNNEVFKNNKKIGILLKQYDNEGLALLKCITTSNQFD